MSNKIYDNKHENIPLLLSINLEILVFGFRFLLCVFPRIRTTITHIYIYKCSQSDLYLQISQSQTKHIKITPQILMI